MRSMRGKNSGWIQKESLPYHLKSDVMRSVHAQQNRDSIRKTGENPCKKKAPFRRGWTSYVYLSIERQYNDEARVSDQVWIRTRNVG